MNPTNAPASNRRERTLGSWCGSGLVLALATITAWLVLAPASRVLDAQQVPAAAPRMEYSQMNIYYTKMADTLNERGAKGWEPLEIIPVYPANPGVGGPMTVSIVFRRPLK